MAKAAESKPTHDSAVLRWLGVIVMTLLLIICLAVYFAFPFRANQKRVVGLYLSKAKALVRHDNYDEAVDALNKAAWPIHTTGKYKLND